MKNNHFLLFVLILINFFLILPLLKYSITYRKIYANTTQKALIDYKSPDKPIVINKDNFPILDSLSYILVDVDTNTILAQKNPKERIYPASITKLATALTALNIYPLEEVITIPGIYEEGKTMKLVTGEKITIKSLVEALLVYSANDAAYNLALHHGSGIPGFITDMNKLLKKYQIENTNFINFDGIHDFNHYSTAYDLAQLGRLAIKNSIIKDIVRQKQITVTDIDNIYQHELISTNELLGIIPEIQGLKTGWTPEASGCFISLINIDGHQLIGVVTQSLDRFNDTKKMIDWSKNSIIW